MSSGPGVSAAFCAVLVDEWVRAGVTDAVVAPGSRSTPLLVAVANDGRLRAHVVLDERSAGFLALGIDGDHRLALLQSPGQGIPDGAGLGEAVDQHHRVTRSPDLAAQHPGSLP